MRSNREANGSHPTNGIQPPAPKERRATDQSPQSTIKLGSQAPPRSGGGPRTPLGKAVSRGNARTHGIFANVVLLDDEPRAKFKALLRGFRDDLQPVGTIENSLVEKLAILDWRYRRLLQAETAESEYEKKFNSRALDRRREERAKAIILEISATGCKYGLIEGWQNPVVLRRILEELVSLRDSIQLLGLNPDRDLETFDMVFGRNRRCELRGLYEICRDPKAASAYPAGKDFDLPPEELKALFLDRLANYINVLKRRQKSLERLSNVREKLERRSSGVPESGRLDRLLRYEANIQREYDRVLNQLERLQHARKGQPVLPTLKVNVATLN